MKTLAWAALGLLLGGVTPLEAERNPKALEVVRAAIKAMGGARYLAVRNVHSEGRYFVFDRHGRTRGFTHFRDWTSYDPIKWRFQLGKGGRKEITIFNLEIQKGWKQEGKSSVEEAPEKAVRAFAKTARRDIDVLLRQRLDEDGMNLFYYSPDDIGGEGDYEAVEFLDASNDSVIVYFDLKTHLPYKIETKIRNKLGVQLTQETEFYNWHTFQGVLAPMRYDTYVGGKKSSQRFLEKLAFNTAIPPGYFLEPIVGK